MAVPCCPDFLSEILLTTLEFVSLAPSIPAALRACMWNLENTIPLALSSPSFPYNYAARLGTLPHYLLHNAVFHSMHHNRDELNIRLVSLHLHHLLQWLQVCMPLNRSNGTFCIPPWHIIQSTCGLWLSTHESRNICPHQPPLFCGTLVHLSVIRSCVYRQILYSSFNRCGDQVFSYHLHSWNGVYITRLCAIYQSPSFLVATTLALVPPLHTFPDCLAESPWVHWSPSHCWNSQSSFPLHQAGRVVVFCWVPDCTGLHGSEVAAEAASVYGNIPSDQAVGSDVHAFLISAV